jgi:hypothetical protein
MRSIPAVAMICFAAAITSGEVAAQVRPDFSGHWVADIENSSGAGIDLPLSAGYVITQGRDSATAVRSTISQQGTLGNRMVLRFDGVSTRDTMWVFAGAPGTQERVGMEATFVARWAQDTLVVQITSKLHTIQLQQTIRWVMNADRTSFTEHREASADGNDLGAQDIVYRRKG